MYKRQAPINALSGGERNRLLLARLFTKPANVLVLDEPTNDLDVETLELLEYTILEFPGTVLMVSHDREFIDNIATSTIALDGNGSLAEYVGGYTDYLKQTADKPQATGKKSKAAQPTGKNRNSQTDKSQTKLSYKFKRELDLLPVQIEKMESKKEKLEQQLADPTTYQDGQTNLTKLQEEYAALEKEITTAYERWDELENMSEG